MDGKLYLCPTPIGNLEDITLRTLRILKEVDLVAAEDTRRSLKLLNYFKIKKPLISYFEHNKRERGAEIIHKIRQGQNVALVTDAGMPAISDPGEELVKQCIEENITVISLPGANAALTALVASGLPTGRFSFQGFLTVNKTARREHLRHAAELEETLIFYEAPHKLRSTLKDMREYFGNRKIALCRELTKTFEEFVRTDLDQAILRYQEMPPKGEFVLILEGAAQKAAQPAEELALRQIYQGLLEQGFSDKEALKAAAKEKGIPKRQAYTELKIQSEPEE